MFDKYTQFLICSTGQVSATVLSEITDDCISHDAIARFLFQSNFDNKLIWKTVRPIVRDLEGLGVVGVISIDDSIIEKPR